MGLGPYLQAEFAQTSGRPNDIPIMILIDLGYNEIILEWNYITSFSVSTSLIVKIEFWIAPRRALILFKVTPCGNVQVRFGNPKLSCVRYLSSVLWEQMEGTSGRI